jgi:hypothetical protein
VNFGELDGLSGWAASVNSLNAEHAPISLLSGTAFVPSLPNGSLTREKEGVRVVRVNLESEVHIELRKALVLRPPHGWIVAHEIGGLSGGTPLLRAGCVLTADSRAAWDRLETGASSHAVLRFAPASFVWWNGAQQPDGCLSLLQPVMHYVGGTGSGWGMDIWHIPYFPRNKSFAGHGATRAAATSGMPPYAYVPLLPGESVTMGVQLVSSPAQRAPPLMRYVQWWSLTSNSTPIANDSHVDGGGGGGDGGAFGQGGSDGASGCELSYELIYDDCDPFGEGGDCRNCALTRLEQRRGTATVLPGGRMRGGVRECGAACCDDPRCRAVNFSPSELTCELLGAHSDARTEAAPGWTLLVLGQALTSVVDSSWKDPNGGECATPASWTFGAVLEIFAADAPTQLPPLLTMAGVRLGVVGQPPHSPLPQWTRWLSDGAKSWNMSLTVTEEGRSIELSVPRPLHGMGGAGRNESHLASGTRGVTSGEAF